jgi:putative flippase GtrA
VIRLLRYGLVGLVQNGLMYLVGLGLIALGAKGWQATAATYPVAVLISFVLNRGWTFSDRVRDRSQILRYILVYAAVYFLSVATVWTLELIFPAWLALLLAIPVGALAIYVGLNLWVFPNAPRDQP